MVRKLSEDAAAASNLTPTTVIDHVRRCRVLENDFKEAQEEAKAKQALFRNEVKRGYNDLGIPKDAWPIFWKFLKLDTDETKSTLRNLTKLAKFMQLPWGTQLDIFADAKGAADEITPEAKEEAARVEAEQAGYLRGVAGDTQDENPHPGGSPQHVGWYAGWKKGHEFHQRSTEASGDTAVKTKPRGRSRPSGNPEDAVAA